VLYHLKERAAEHAVIPWCEQHGTAFVAYSPFGHGDFPNGGVLAEIAKELNATLRQVALRYLLRQPSVFAIPKASNIDHVVENAGAGRLRLDAGHIARIDEAFPRGPKPRHLPML
jgi:diketogulonate reductase-like aldo/keto reductase